jgi:hypothetical protein
MVGLIAVPLQASITRLITFHWMVAALVGPEEIREWIPIVIPNLRVRLTALYGGIFVVFAALLLLASYWLIQRHSPSDLRSGEEVQIAHSESDRFLARGHQTPPDRRLDPKRRG